MRLFTGLFLTSTLFTATAYAGGVGLGATRVVYSGAASQSTLQVRNTHTASTFLIQSWVENAAGERSNDFIITPPLYVLKPSTESVVKIMFTGKALPQDRETLYWITVKAIPQQNKSSAANSLQFASANRIKIFYRPEGISHDASHAWKKLGGNVRDGKVTLTNPTPYYLTTINLKIDGKPVAPVMVPPRANLTLEGSFASARTLSYQIINDFGAWTSPTDVPLARN
ncbi:TPA: fimbria/pilus periplasmic chaperone [Kluyvera ascorbata]|nr:fimbria/pilus periplasmic chaperone [Kluyvera ascorbata]HDT6547807.1 fimbria/pilus periplasmic chaperone [Kluyvera ascorbata]